MMSMMSRPADMEAMASLDQLDQSGAINETPHNVFIGHNLGNRVFTMSVPFRQFYNMSDVANDRETGPVAQRPLDMAHARRLAVYMLRGLVSAAFARRQLSGKEPSPAYEQIMQTLGNQPYFSLQPMVCNIRNVPFGGTGEDGIRGVRLEARNGETAGFKVFLSEAHILWVIDGQHRRKGADLVMEYLEQVRLSGFYPTNPLLYPDKGREISEAEMSVWNDVYDATRALSTLTVEVHLGLNIEQERQLFHDLNKLGRKVDPSLALQFDAANPISLFIRDDLIEKLGLTVDSNDSALTLKDVAAINAIAFLNKSNINGAAPTVVNPRESTVRAMWEQIMGIPGFTAVNAREQTVAAQPVMLKALAKVLFDLAFSNRKPEKSEELTAKFIEGIKTIDFSHDNKLWRFYTLSQAERKKLGGLPKYLPKGDDRELGVLNDAGKVQFDVKHNDIYPVLADMIRWTLKLPSRF